MRRTKAKWWSAAAALLMMAAMAGCGGSSARDLREDRDPLLRRAREHRNAQDIQGAVDLYQRALEKKPYLARAHLELAWIYDHDLEDYVSAIYHYQRYLDMRPDAEKKELVQDLIQHAKLSFAASLPDRPSEAIREIAMLKQEISALKDQLGQNTPPVEPKPAVEPAGSAVTGPGPIIPRVAVAPGATPAPAPAQPAMEPYVVQSGDTLSRIAAKVYGDSSKWQMIFEANRSTLSGPQSIRVGQTLLIPKQEHR